MSFTTNKLRGGDLWPKYRHFGTELYAKYDKFMIIKHFFKLVGKIVSIHNF